MRGWSWNGIGRRVQLKMGVIGWIPCTHYTPKRRQWRRRSGVFNKFCTLFWCFHCWFWRSKCWLGSPCKALGTSRTSWNSLRNVHFSNSFVCPQPFVELYFVFKLCFAEACNLTKNSTPPWVFFKFFKLCKWYQIAQNVTLEQNKTLQRHSSSHPFIIS